MSAKSTEFWSQGRAKLRDFPRHCGAEKTKPSPSFTPTLGILLVCKFAAFLDPSVRTSCMEAPSVAGIAAASFHQCTGIASSNNHLTRCFIKKHIYRGAQKGLSWVRRIGPSSYVICQSRLPARAVCYNFLPVTERNLPCLFVHPCNCALL